VNPVAAKDKKASCCVPKHDLKSVVAWL
jgi:hypothetical protein